MFHSRDDKSLGPVGLHLYAARYPDEDEGGAYCGPVRSGTKPAAAVRDLDELGHAVVPRTIPDFWKPVEEWTLD